MQTFFSNLDSLDHFTHSLQTLSQEHACTHCEQNDQWVSHGYVYKQRSIHRREVVGKRMVCCRRFGKEGCGRTRQLYLDHIVPQRHHTLLTLITFIAGLLQGRSVIHAYQDAAGCLSREPRHAWRWFNALYQQLGGLRSKLGNPFHYPQLGKNAPFQTSRRRAALLPTLCQLLPLSLQIQFHLQQRLF